MIYLLITFILWVFLYFFHVQYCCQFFCTCTYLLFVLRNAIFHKPTHKRLLLKFRSLLFFSLSFFLFTFHCSFLFFLEPLLFLCKIDDFLRSKFHVFHNFVFVYRCLHFNGFVYHFSELSISFIKFFVAYHQCFVSGSVCSIFFF